jgi:undecaprenyl phosphate N,N'-diacetylbacillosamine 1-phosphate transferase
MTKRLYRDYIKRFLDIVLSAGAIIVLSPVMAVTAVLVRVKLGSPVIFKQKRPGKDERIFEMYKFRSMTDARDENGELLPDEVRLTSFGKKLRASSLDELPELFNILKGDMSVVGPRPLLVRDMVFMTVEQRKRHSVRPGLTGLAQVSGRNAIDWEKKLAYDLEYIKRITFFGDMEIICQTARKALLSQEGITEEGMATAEDYGDYLLRMGKVSREEYGENQEKTQEILARETK